MKHALLLLFFVSIVSIIAALPLFAQSNSDVWVTAYYAGWSQGQYNNGVLPAGEIDFSAVTHIIHFSILPRTDGSINAASNTVIENNSNVLIEKAHAAGKKVIISLGGWGSEDLLRDATSPLKLVAFIDSLIAFIRERGYDGIDIDWEPIRTADLPQYIAFVTALHLRLQLMNPRPLLTAAVASQPEAIAALANKFDQINVMTYDMSGAWPGWVVWHTSPLSNSGLTFPSTGRALPSASELIERYVEAGVPVNKLGIGIPFYGYVWSGGNGTNTGGATQPLQTWTSPPSVRANVSYSDIMEQYYQPDILRWDSTAATPYLSIDKPGSADDKFISLENERSIWEKFEYARERGLGGVFIWELGGGHRHNLPEGQRDGMLQAVKRSAQGNPPGTDVTAPTVSFLSPGDGAILSGTVEIRVNANDNIGIAGVLFQLDGNPIGQEDTSPPYSILLNTFDIANGPHTITARARDAAGNNTTDTVSVTVDNQALPAAPALASPPDNATGVERNPILVWQTVAGAMSYDVQVAVEPDFSPLVVNQSGVQTTQLPLGKLSAGTKHYWRIRAVNQAGGGPFSPAWSFTTKTAGDFSGVPTEFVLHQNFPNPFNPETEIIFGVPEESDVLLFISDLLGRQVAFLARGRYDPGFYRVKWQGKDKAGRLVDNGVYFYFLEVSGISGSRYEKANKMLLLK